MVNIVTFFIACYWLICPAYLWKLSHDFTQANSLSDDYDESPVKPNKNIIIGQEYFFKQKLDHFNSSDNAFWQQRYFINHRNYKFGGPIFIYIHGENEANKLWVSNGQWMTYAKLCRAVCFSLEHRFYGTSRPKLNTDTENLTYLKTDQVVEDIIHFVKGLTNIYNIPNNTKAILFGCSYGGYLAVLSCLKYPDFIHGVIASSTPVKVEINFPGYFETVKNVLYSYNSKCSSKVEKINEEITSLLKSGYGRNIVKKMFGFCSTISSEPKDWISIIEFLADTALGFTVQYDGNLKIDSCKNVSIAKLCETMNQNYSALECFANYTKFVTRYFKEECWQHGYQFSLDILNETRYNVTDQSTRLWFYQTCSEYGFFQSSENKNHLFGTNIPFDFFIHRCQQVFGSRFNKETLSEAAKKLNNNFSELRKNGSNIVFVYGTNDPWISLAMENNTDENFEIIKIPGISHCADLISSENKSNEDLKLVHEKIFQHLKKWLDI